MLAHNKLTMNTDFDLELLQGELAGISELDMSLFGFDIYTEPVEVLEDDFEPELPDEPVTKPGDIWILGRHRLMCGDTTDEQAVTALMNGHLVDMYLTDPPYNVDYIKQPVQGLPIGSPFSYPTKGRSICGMTRRHDNSIFKSSKI